MRHERRHGHAPVRMLDGEVEAEHTEQLALTDEHLFLELKEQVLVALGALVGRVLHLVRLDNHVAQLLGRLLHLRGQEEARCGHLWACSSSGIR